MSRRRFIRPSFWESAAATSIGAGTRLLLIGCWTLADDEGVLRWDPATVRELLFPSDRDISDEHVESWMYDLSANDLVLRYRGTDAFWYGYLVGFERDHRPERPKVSCLPAPNPKNLGVQKAYLSRDDFTCHLCDAPIPAPGTWEDVVDPEDPDTVLVAEMDFVEPRTAGGGVHPSNVASAHAGCVQARAGRPVAEARQDPEVLSMGVLAHRYSTGFGTVSGDENLPSDGMETAPEDTAFDTVGLTSSAGSGSGVDACTPSDLRKHRIRAGSRQNQ